jgi:hypothetical protein
MSKTEPLPGRMIHIRLPEDLHKQMRIRVAELDTTIQHWVAALVERELATNPQPLREEEDHDQAGPAN